MIALLGNYEYFMDGNDNIRDFLISYANYIGLDMKIFNILANSGEMSHKELVEYINRFCDANDTNDTIEEIYEIGKKVY